MPDLKELIERLERADKELLQRLSDYSDAIAGVNDLCIGNYMVALALQDARARIIQLGQENTALRARSSMGE
jgi:hypothetical protein